MRIGSTSALLGLLVSVLCASATGAFAMDPAGLPPLVVPTLALPGGGTGLRASVAGHTGLFLFDTGAGVTLVTPATAALAGCRPWGQVTGFRATGERMAMPRCDDVQLAIGGRQFVVPTASLLDLQPMMGPDMPTLAGVVALDLFAGHAITIRPMAHELVVETPASLRQRTQGATEVPARLVRDAEGLAITVDAAVRTPAGLAWMELDIGNGGPIMVDRHVAAPLGLAPASHDRQQASFQLVGGVPVHGPARVGDLILDGDIGADILNGWDVTFDLTSGRVWFHPATSRPATPE